MSAHGVGGVRRPLFSEAYTRLIYEGIKTSNKQLVILESDTHLILNEDLDRVLPEIFDILAQHSPLRSWIAEENGSKPTDPAGCR
jgi:hypothetical protein